MQYKNQNQQGRYVMKSTLFFFFALALFSGAAYAQNADASSSAAPASPVLSAPAANSDDSTEAIQPTAAPVHTSRPVSFRKDGLWFATHDNSTHLQVHGYIQGDDRMFSATTHGEELDTFVFRRIRPLFEGTLFNNVDFRFMPDFGQNNPQIQEAFLELKTLPFAKLRVGKFKEPIGLEVLRSDRELTFTERSMASDLIPLRYIGAQISGGVISDSITYAAGYFNGSSDGSNGVFTQWAHSNEAAARVFLHPFAATSVNSLHGLGLGLGGSAGSQHGSIAGLKTIGQTTFFKYSSTTVADGQHNRLSPQAYYYIGPFGMMGEWVLSSQEVLNKSNIGRVRNTAWQTEASFVLTGEKNTYGGVRPRNSFEPNRGFGHLGALELAVRYSQVRIDGDAFSYFAKAATSAQFAEEQGIGINWYLNRYVKLASDYEHTGFRMASSTVTPLHSENVLMSRIQLAF
jgi:phosphate-selective porin OprO/OprP